MHQHGARQSPEYRRKYDWAGVVPHTIEEKELAEEGEEEEKQELDIIDAVRQRCAALSGRITVYRMEQISRDVIITRGLSKLKDSREQPTSEDCSNSEVRFTPARILCTQNPMSHGSVDAARSNTAQNTTTRQEANRNSSFHFKGRKGFCLPKLPTCVRIPSLFGHTQTSKIHNLESLG